MDVVSYGEVVVDLITLVERFPRGNEKIFAERVERHPGGVCANFAVAASRLGLETGFMGAVGDDVEGRFLVEALKREGVDVARLLTLEGKPSPVNIVLVEKGGNRVIVQSAYMLSTQLTPDDVDPGYIAGFRAFHTSAIIPGVAERASQAAKEKGLLISFDLEEQVAVYGLRAIRNILRNTDILLTGLGASAIIFPGAGALDSLMRFARYGPKTVVAKLGEKGCAIVTKGRVERVPAFKVKPVDTTGAGDAFDAACIYGTLKGMSPEEAGRFGNAAAALKCLRTGAQAGLPTREEVETFLSEQRSKSG